MIAASIVMSRALAPVEQAVGQWKQFVGARQAHKRLAEIFDILDDEVDRMELPPPSGNLSVQNLIATAPGSRAPILKGVSFSITQGEVLAVIGPSGSGKSTLVRHLVGAAQPQSGAVRLEGTELHHWDREQLGRYIGYMPQDVKLFRGSVSENIARFDETASDEEIVAAATVSGAHEMITTLSDGYDTDVGDGGNGLSGGQRQRVGLARAVFREPSLIVLDEPNSNLDSHGEQALAACIQEMKKCGKTVVLVTHKANLLALSDKALMLVNGTVEKFGETREIFAQAQQKAQAAQQKQDAVVKAANPAVVNIANKPRA
jgi:ATP-binding cassette subfamily C protein